MRLASAMPPRCRRRARFTLVELLAVAALLAIIGGLLVRFYANVQRAYGESLRVAVLGQDARAVFSLLTRDLRLAVTRDNDLPGQSIRIHQPAPGQLWFVSSNEAGGVGASLVELGYRVSGTTLQRAEVDGGDASWNPYGDRDDASTQGGYEPVVDRVVGFRFRCFNRRLEERTPDQTVILPAMVGIELTLLDQKSFAQWERLGTTQRDTYASQRGRTFRKTVQIPAAQFTGQ